MAVFAGVELFAVFTQILHGQGRPPSTVLCIRKLETLSYSVTRPRISDKIPECDGQTVGLYERTNLPYIAYTALARLNNHSRQFVSYLCSVGSQNEATLRENPVN